MHKGTKYELSHVYGSVIVITINSNEFWRSKKFDYFVIVVFCGPWVKLLGNFQFHTRS